MRLYTHPVSRIERLASFAMATGVTTGIALLVVAAPGRFVFTSEWESAPPLDARPVSERLVYVAPPPPAPAAVPSRQAARSSVRTEPQPVTRSPVREEMQTRSADSASRGALRDQLPLRVPDATTAPEPTIGTTNPSPAAAGAPAATASVGFRRPSSGPIRFDSALRALSENLGDGLATGRLAPPPLTQAERDTKWRADAFDVVAARGAGEPVRRSVAGGSIALPLPFGGPSTKQRERDRAIYAQLMATVALRQKKVDSVVAARQRRRADSLARITDSLRPDVRR
jgi:hypothetical protein